MGAADFVFPNAKRLEALRFLWPILEEIGVFQSMRVPEFAVSRTQRLRGVEDG